MMDYPSNFTRDELLKSELAVEHKILNRPINTSIEINLIYLANWLQRLRDALTKHYDKEMPVIVTSGYRNPRLNSLAGGTRTSFHLKGLAADIRVPGMTTTELMKFIIQNFIDYDQVIEEYGRWVHIGLARPRRDKLQKKSGQKYQAFVV